MHGLYTLLVLATVFLAGNQWLLAQTIPPSYPKNADLGVNSVFLSFRKSVEDTLGKDLDEVRKPSQAMDREVVRELACSNQTGSQVLVLRGRVDAAPNSFQHFRVAKSDTARHSRGCVFPGLEEFESFRGIRLGMTVGQVTKILGENYTVSSLDNYITLRYSIVGNQFSDFLNYYRELEYRGVYKFVSGKLQEFSFGFVGGLGQSELE